MLTHNQKHSWFYFDTELIQYLTDEDKKIAHIQILDEQFARIFYPPEKQFVNQVDDIPFKLEANLDIKQLEAKLKKAFYDDNRKVIKEIKKQIKEFYGT